MGEVVKIWRIWRPSGANDASSIVGMLKNMLPYGSSNLDQSFYKIKVRELSEHMMAVMPD